MGANDPQGVATQWAGLSGFTEGTTTKYISPGPHGFREEF